MHERLRRGESKESGQDIEALLCDFFALYELAERLLEFGFESERLTIVVAVSVVFDHSIKVFLQVARLNRLVGQLLLDGIGKCVHFE